MFKRKAYIKENRQKPWTIKDEPPNNIVMDNEEARSYPDMYEAYTNFAKTYNLSMDSFILTNGCENALRIVLELLRPKYLYIENPSWGLVEVLGNGLLYPKVDSSKKEQRIFFVNYKFEQEKFILDTFPIKLPNEESVFYITDKYNNMFEHNVLYNKNSYAKYTLLDETYSAVNLRNSNRHLQENIFIIGSYSKFCGAGIRLGYVLYHPKWNNYMQLLREECISKLAVKYTKVFMPQIKLPYYDGKYVCKSNNYIVVKANEYEGDFQRINKEFTISGIKFYKLGLPLR